MKPKQYFFPLTNLLLCAKLPNDRLDDERFLFLD